jgi:hypothetical protein
LAEWLASAHPGAFVQTRVFLGRTEPASDAAGLTPAEVRMLGTARRWVDAVVIDADTVHLYEAKIRLEPKALAELALYNRLFPYTQEFQTWKDWPRKLHLLYAVPDVVVLAMAREQGLLAHQYRPAWVDGYLASLAANKRVGTAPGGLQDELDIPPEGTT